ncbi:subtilisin-like protease SBT3 [Pyrus communis]|uniref:subtilisin-like protease SBT3 n=1 Tax=Pyrus communis TaxID=23211 RepID=UPI0035C1DDE3
MAPGSLVLAAWSPKVASVQIGFIVNLPSDYNLISGTSMACSHASGVAELLKGAHPGWSATAIRSALMATANPLDTTRNPFLDGDHFNSASPLTMGTGRIDPNRALEPGLTYDAASQEYVNLLCSTNFTRKQSYPSLDRAYDCSKPSSYLNYPSFIALYILTKQRQGSKHFRGL